jgi:hypothetical protein
VKWRDLAVCKGAYSVYFPAFNDMKKDSKHLYTEAKKVCSTCPVSGYCLDYAIENNEQYGVWGGKTPKEIRAHAALLERKGQAI